jgi:hypothetical protein
MINTNLYTTLAEFKDYATPRDQHPNISVDAADDAVLASILGAVSRDIDDQCHRTFYPRFETRKFSVPVYTNSPRLLLLDDDLLQETSIINGDGTDIFSLVGLDGNKVYNLRPKNYEPKFAIQLVGPTYIFWIFNRIGSIEYVLSVTGWWGFHNHYTQRAFTPSDTLGVAITDTSSLTFTCAAGPALLADQQFKIDNEIFNAASVNTTAHTVTVNQRGDNGSTPATHLNAAPLYLWNAQPEIKLAALETALDLNQARSGQSSPNGNKVTPAGKVLGAIQYSPWARGVITSFTRSIL